MLGDAAPNTDVANRVIMAAREHWFPPTEGETGEAPAEGPQA
jgi:hypothetical protein